MILDQITKKQDEFYTPRYAVRPLLKYVPKGSRILCPFDTDASEFVRNFREHECEVTCSHIFSGRSFWDLDYSREDYDFVISNPPYSRKGDVFQRLFERGVPFAMLVGVVGLFESQERFSMFRDHPFEVMYLNRRVSYFDGTNGQKPALNPPFSSVYVASGVFPERIVFEEIDKRDFRPLPVIDAEAEAMLA